MPCLPPWKACQKVYPPRRLNSTGLNRSSLMGSKSLSRTGGLYCIDKLSGTRTMPPHNYPAFIVPSILLPVSYQVQRRMTLRATRPQRGEGHNELVEKWWPLCLSMLRSHILGTQRGVHDLRDLRLSYYDPGTSASGPTRAG